MFSVSMSYSGKILIFSCTEHFSIISEQPKIGIKDRSGSVIGFIFCSYNEKLCNVKPLAVQEVILVKWAYVMIMKG